MKTDMKKEALKQRCQDILSELVKINTTHPEGNEMDTIKTILSYFKDFPVSYGIFDHGENRGSMVITIPGKDSSRSVAFIGHVDTVPIEGEWTHSPFEAVVEGDLMYGRGTADMKGGVTAMILTALYMLEEGVTPACDVQFCFTADEEANGIGVLRLKEAGVFDRVRELVIPEPTNEQIGIAEKGALWLNVTVGGKPAHGSRPELGVNAIEWLAEFVRRLKSGLDLGSEHPLLGRTTVSVNTIAGGSKTNIIPARAAATLDIRTVPAVSNDSVIMTANQVATEMMDGIGDLTINVAVENNRPAIETEAGHEFVQGFKKLCDQVGIAADFKGLFFYTDASQVVPDLGVPFVIMGPGDDAQAHQRNEHTAISSVAIITELYIRYVTNLV